MALFGLGRTDMDVRANAARALAKSCGAAQVETLVALASGDTQPLRVRQEAALALGAIRDPAAVPALVQALQRAEPDGSRDGEQLRISIVQALGALGTTEARAALSAHSQRPLSTTEAAFTASELAALNAKKKSNAPFDPYAD